MIADDGGSDLWARSGMSGRALSERYFGNYLKGTILALACPDLLVEGRTAILVFDPDKLSARPVVISCLRQWDGGNGFATIRAVSACVHMPRMTLSGWFGGRAT